MASILVIDDHAAVLETAKVVLAKQGHEVRTAPNGKLGMSLSSRRRFDLIITDIIMPEQDGIETIEQLRRVSPDLPILAISGCGMVGDTDFLKAALAMGANDTLAKPFRASELVDKVSALLATVSAARSAATDSLRASSPL
ncbi:MAG: response regulator [Alphaproteobacteria bacterium]|nr:response regulator [Alphaproteobacteria bacterium]